jgi:hypothetical protein
MVSSGFPYLWIIRLRGHAPKPFLWPLYFRTARLRMSRIRNTVLYDTRISGAISVRGTKLSLRRVLRGRFVSSALNSRAARVHVLNGTLKRASGVPTVTLNCRLQGLH